MRTLNHTALPWMVRDDHPERACLHITAVGAPSWEDIATVYTATENAADDAEFIVRAANAHHTLATLLANVLDEYHLRGLITEYTFIAARKALSDAGE